MTWHYWLILKVSPSENKKKEKLKVVLNSETISCSV